MRNGHPINSPIVQHRVTFSIHLLALGLIFLYSCGGTKQDPGGQQESIVPDSLIRNGVYIHHKEYGSGEYSLVFIHGWCINQTYWDDQMPYFETDYQVVSLDMPGFGLSGKNRDSWTIEEYGKDVDFLIDELELSKVILIGHSMGGDIAVEAALRNENVIAFIGIDNFKDVGMSYDEVTQAQIDEFMEMLRNNFSVIAPAYAEGSLFHPSTDSLVRKRVMHDFKNCDSIAALASLEALIRYGEIESGQLEKVDRKMYLLNSNASPTSRSGLDSTGIAYAVFEIDSTGHYPMIEKPDEFNRILEEIIEEIQAEEGKS